MSYKLFPKIDVVRLLNRYPYQVVGITSNKKYLTLGGFFICKATKEFVKPLQQDLIEGIEMLQLHHDRLGGGTAKKILGDTITALKTTS